VDFAPKLLVEGCRVNSTTTTNVLLLINTGLLVQLAFPQWAQPVWFALGLAGLMAGINWLSVTYQRKKAERSQKKIDEKLWREYDAAHRAIRKKYDPENKWNEATSVPRDYQEEIDDLNHSYRGMLKRRFGDDW